MDIIELVPESVARENNILPIDQNGTDLMIAVSNPNDVETIEKLRFILNRPISTMVAPKEAITSAINQYYGQVEGESADCMLQEFTDTAIDFTETDSDDFDEYLPVYAAGDNLASIDDGVMEDDIDTLGNICQSAMPPSPFSFAPAMRSSKRKRVTKPESDAAPVIRLVNLIIAEAVHLSATHILVMPETQAIRISYAVDGRLVERESAPRRMLTAIIARLKILAKLDITINDQLQTGLVAITVGDHSCQCRVHLARCGEATTALIELDPTSTDEPEAVSQWRKEFASKTAATKHSV